MSLSRMQLSGNPLDLQGHISWVGCGKGGRKERRAGMREGGKEGLREEGRE
jgi:hypothetical protein